MLSSDFFFLQAEDGIRDYDVTGVQTCALPTVDGYECLMTDETQIKNGVDGPVWSHGALPVDFEEET